MKHEKWIRFLKQTTIEEVVILILFFIIGAIFSIGLKCLLGLLISHQQ